MIAALYVDPKGCYAGLEGVELWDEARDARNYAGPWPVVAHPPCERWGRYWHGGPSVKVRKKLGDDGGCFASAFQAAYTFGGVIEHPEATHAWRTFGIERPPHQGGWVNTGILGAKTCCVEQGWYGHPARKKTWLIAFWSTQPLPDLKWGKAPGEFNRLDQGFHSKEERARSSTVNKHKRLSKREASATPPAFRDILLSIARSCRNPLHGTPESP